MVAALRKVTFRLKSLSKKKKGILLLFLVIIPALFWFCLPSPLFDSPTSFVIESTEGKLLGASIARDGQWRFPASDTVPEKFRRCIITFEDKRYYSHPGIDILAVSRALLQNLKGKKIVSGGSTISMQVIRLYSGGRRSFFNKILEAVKTLRLELGYSKEEILSLYAAHAPFGSNVVGLDAASWRYFGRNPSQLSWGEMASLAVLPNAPSLVHPGRNRDILLTKRNRLIDMLQSTGVLDATEARLAKLEPVPGKPLPLPELAPHLLNLVRSDYKKGIISETRIRTSIRAGIQERVSNILESHHKTLLANQVNNCAALVLSVKTGEVLSYNGNIYEPALPEMESHVDIIQARRSPGSTLKPLLYAAMLNEGMLLPNSLVPDIPTQIAGYQPNNYDLGYDGAVPASKALARSLNVPAVKMLQQYRYERFHHLLKALGISTLNQPPDFYGLSLILGGCETSLWELAGIYASMARTLNRYTESGGKYYDADWRKPQYIMAGKEDKGTEAARHGRLDAAAIYFTFEAMNELMRPGEELLWKRFSSSQQIAWKTGTSFGFRDGWAIGVTPEYVVAVWAGNADGEGRPGLTGIDAAAPVLFDIFRILPASGKDWFSKPSGELTDMEICQESGFRASELCTYKKTSVMPAACLKAPACTFHRVVHLDASGQWQVNSECESTAGMIHKSWFVLPPAMEYYYRKKNYSYRELPAFRPGCEPSSAVSQMELIYPKNAALIYVPFELDGQKGQVVFSAAHRNTDETIFWHLDNTFVGKTRELHQMPLSPPPGKHTITLIDNEGNRLQQTFTILSKEENKT